MRILSSLFVAFAVLAFCTTCQRNPAGTRLFEVIYPVTDFVIPAGQPSFQTLVIAQNRVPTGFVDEMLRTGVAAGDIDLVGGLRARVTSLTNDDFGEIERMELRVCPVGQAGGCDQFDLLFSVDDLFRRRQDVVNLSPGLRNFRELFLGSETVRVELIITPGITTSRTLEARLEWSATAVGDLD
ncbi:hypothetical protein QWY85_06415 [Neolewinella lacunae]|uniref:Uncharacterized protein n=1 Tax=Neolewinella lacunae TaxID=1517758 RepID=A0A923PK71_9BACT|nr:hypothetical protein [Neolewinella lacunae]MBC6995648.1 hypothetical protein [Neolewinella lacunae]MDN3634285.1 hypothetical protein [Neolewinella lacunae]